MTENFHIHQKNKVHDNEFTLEFVLIICYVAVQIYTAQQNGKQHEHCNFQLFDVFLHISCFLLLVNIKFGTFLTKAFLNLTI